MLAKNPSMLKLFQIQSTQLLTMSRHDEEEAKQVSSHFVDS